MFLLSTDLPDPKSHLSDIREKEQWKRYQTHLRNISAKLPPATREFALADWHYNWSDPRCPHDAWLESTVVKEKVVGEDPQCRRMEILVRLLGAYHDGHIELNYEGVVSYCLDFPARDLRNRPNQGHGDWWIDEIRFSDRGKVLHAIEWMNGPRWFIECDDIHYRWIPLSGQQ